MRLRELSERYREEVEKTREAHHRVEGILHYLLYLQTRYSGDYQVDPDMVDASDDWRGKINRSIRKQQAEIAQDVIDPNR